MTRRYRMTLVGGLLALVVATGCVTPPTPEATGGEIFQQTCARCHGSDLGGGVGPALGPGSAIVDQPDSQVRLSIERGVGSMPAFGSSLSAEQIDRVVAFLRVSAAP